MAIHHETGKKGEGLAAEYLEQHRFIILHRNWRHSHYEIDIIATRDHILHFVEVKTRRNHTFGYPEEGVSRLKLKSLQRAGAAYLYQNPQWKRIQYDILAISLLPDQPPAFFLIEDVS